MTEKVPYQKPFISCKDQIVQLKSRGLIIDDELKPQHILDKIGYYRLSGYWFPLLANPKTNHRFKPESNFSTAFKLYCFDNELRKLIFSELIKIEIAIRAKIVHVLSEKYDPFWYLNRQLFSEKDDHEEIISEFKEMYKRSDEQFIIHFKKRYSNELPPSWMIFEVATFGKLSKLFSILNVSNEKKEISHYYGIEENVFSSWLHALVYVRNICAHNTRLWNRILSITPQVPLTLGNDWIKITSQYNTIRHEDVPINNRVYFILCIIRYLLLTINPQSNFNFKIKSLLDKYLIVDKRALGFTDLWEDEALWKDSPILSPSIPAQTFLNTNGIISDKS